MEFHSDILRSVPSKLIGKEKVASQLLGEKEAKSYLLWMRNKAAPCPTKVPLEQEEVESFLPS